MATYLYCVRSDRAEPPVGLAGIDGEPVRTVSAATLVAWVSDVSEVNVTATIERLRAHDAVCAAALDTGDTPLPIRFGQSFTDDASAADAVDSRAIALASRLERVSGCVELRVVISRVETGDESRDPETSSATHATSSADAPIGPGTAFLQRLARAGRADLAREVGCEDARHAIREAASSFIVDQQRCESARGLAYFPVLVRRGDVRGFRGAVSEILESKAIHLSVLGPFAPYSFSGDT